MFPEKGETPSIIFSHRGKTDLHFRFRNPVKVAKCDHHFRIICLTETWNTNDLYILKEKEKRGSGGICIYIQEQHHVLKLTKTLKI